nr:MAG TPA: hypothetical protein [Caudoviricetes sp.]
MTKAVKGFNKDMTCRGFQYQEGKEYKTENASLCNEGFHACFNPLDCFRYYYPGDGSVYHEVEIDDNGERGDDSKIVGSKIKIGAKLDVANICKLHFEFVKNQTIQKKDGKDSSSLAAQDYSSLAAQDYSSLAAQDYSSLASRDSSSLAAQDRSSLAAQYRSSLAARDYSSLATQDYSSLAAQYKSSLAAQDYSSLAAQDRSSLAAQDRSSLAAQNWSSLAAQDRSSLAAQDWSSLAAQDWSSLSAGKNSVLACFNGRCRAGLNSLIAIANRKWNGNDYEITDFKAEIVDGEKIKADTWYKLVNGEFVEVNDDES